MRDNLADLWGLPKCLARPVARGYLTEEQADIALHNATLRAATHGWLGPYHHDDVLKGLRHLFKLHTDQLQARRSVASHRIERTVAPLIQQRKPRNAILAEAHGVNGEAAFPLSEPEVSDLVETVVFYALPPAPRGRRNAQ